jgi:hypothetical protein
MDRLRSLCIPFVLSLCSPCVAFRIVCVCVCVPLGVLYVLLQTPRTNERISIVCTYVYISYVVGMCADITLLQIWQA